MNKLLFDSTSADIIHYFVRADDLFVPNSLELLDANEYLYRLLKREGYQRIVFAEQDKTNCRYFAYDKLSHLSILHQKEFEKVDPDVAQSVTSFYDQVNAKAEKNNSGPAGLPKIGLKSTKSAVSKATNSTPDKGRRDVKSFSRLEEFVSDFVNYVSNVLDATNVKSAIVIPLEMFEQAFNKEQGIARKAATQLEDILLTSARKNVRLQNILVLTTTQKENFQKLIRNDMLHNFHRWIPEVLSKTETHNALIRNITECLTDYGCLVTADSIGADEIANLLLRKKMVEMDARFDELPVSKIYPLAEKIRAHLTFETKFFSDVIPFEKKRSFIIPLNALLRKNAVVEELIEFSKKLEAKHISRINSSPVFVERVYHVRTKYIDVDDSAAVLAEFDKLEGKEIQAAKAEVLSAINYFCSARRELEEKKKAGQSVSDDSFPYMNLLFYGAPGTGKTTIANLVGKLMFAKGILPSSKVHTVQAGDLGSGYLHGVQEKLMDEVDKAIGGVLLIDELQGIKGAYAGGDLAEDFMRALVAAINKHRDNMCVILCGYEDEVNRIVQYDIGALRRFQKKIKLESYSLDTLMVILGKLLESDGKTLGEGVEEKLRKIIRSDMKTQGKSFGNVGYLKASILDPIKAAYFERGQNDKIYLMDDLLRAFKHSDKLRILEEKDDSAEAILAEFDKLEGKEIQKAKSEVLSAINYFCSMRLELEEKEKAGQRISDDDFPYMNMLFYGAPGTGKTTIAKLVGRLMFAKGILPSSKVHTVQAGDLGSGHVHGVQEKLMVEADKAVGGVLLIDELQGIKGAYAGGDLAEDFMRALVAVINKYRDSMCVILCGYEDEVNRIVQYDIGALRRFQKKIKLESYSLDTLMVILGKLLESDGKTLGEGVEEKLRKIIRSDMKTQGKSFGNVGYLKASILDPIKTAYFERGQNDKIYLMDDLLRAFKHSDKLRILEEKDDSAEAILAEFDKLEGKEIQKAKSEVLSAINYFCSMRLELEEKEKAGQRISDDDFPYMNMLFYGAPGTGKTTIAKLVGRLMFAKGILPSSKVHTVQAGDLGSGHVHGVQEKLMAEADKAVGGVLLIDEVQGIKGAYAGGDLAEDFMRALVAVINKYRDSMCVILCGYEDEVNRIMKGDDGAPRRFQKKIKLESYSLDTLMVILGKLLESDGKTLGEGVEEKLRKIIRSDMKTQGKSFGNVGYLKASILDPIKAAYFERGQNDKIYLMDDLLRAFKHSDKLRILEEKDDSAEAILAEFDKLEGKEIQKAKKDVLNAVNFFLKKKQMLEKAEQQGMILSSGSIPYMNMLFYGAPGTGKTTIATLVGKLMYAYGILPSSKVHTIQAGDLGSRYVHGVQERLMEEADNAVGGVLLIDELQGIEGAYAGGDLAKDFMRALVAVINKYRDSMCVILCGYEEEVNRIVQHDVGAPRRFPQKIKLESYGIDTLMIILHRLLKEDEKTLGEGAEEKIREIILSEISKQGKHFGNVGYLKDILLAKIESSYYARGDMDDVYTIEDIIAAFPEEARETKQNAGERMPYQRLSSSLFEHLPAPYDASAVEDREKLHQATDPAVLFVKTDRGAGTAFLISPDGYAITCNHVIEGATEITARLRILGRPGGSDSFYHCTVINTRADYDIALLKLQQEDGNFPYLKLAHRSRKINRGEEFILSGYPFGDRTAKDMTSFRGTIASSELQRDDNGNICFNIDCQAKCGNSGGPIISTKDGSVLGILLGSITNKSGSLIEEINQMRPIRYFWEEILSCEPRQETAEVN